MQKRTFTSRWLRAWASAWLVGGIAVPAMSGAAGTTVRSGFNLSLPTGPPITVEYTPQGLWDLDVDLIFDPGAGPMLKWFETPTNPVTTDPILLDAQQPFPQPIWEDFYVIPGPPGTPPGYPVSDWHEEILTPGWEWVLPGDARFPSLFPPGQSLVTRNGQPWPWDPQPHPGGPDPTMLWIEFPPIDPGHVFDIHKALLWVGTPDNRVWGDFVDNDGFTIDESLIEVIEYPTPEPASAGLIALGALALLRRR
ncbi:MAG: hypothetical protein AAGE65_15095 [Planctomycetota bacterium]